MDNLITVDIFDKQIGTISKQQAHNQPILHRAFSVFLYNGNKLLIQQRALNKYHSGGLWSNTCCSHPRTNNLFLEANIRLKQEVGIELSPNSLKEIFSFTYLTKFSETLFEHEYDHVLVGEYSGKVHINPEEVNQIKWIDIDSLSADMIENPQKYATWFLICAPKVISYIKTKHVI